MFRLFLGLEYSDFRLLWGYTPEIERFEGLTIAAIAERLGMSEFDAYVHVARETNGKARVLIGTYSGDGDREDQPGHRPAVEPCHTARSPNTKRHSASTASRCAAIKWIGNCVGCSSRRARCWARRSSR